MICQHGHQFADVALLLPFAEVGARRADEGSFRRNKVAISERAAARPSGWTCSSSELRSAQALFKQLKQARLIGTRGNEPFAAAGLHERHGDIV